MGLAYLAAVLEKEGVNVTVVDANALDLETEEVGARISDLEADVVGITATTPNAPRAFAVASCVKKAKPDTLVVMGGVHVTALPKLSLRQCASIDIVVRGEGEYSLLEIVDAHERGQSYSGIKGLTFRSGHSIVRTPDRPLISNLDLLPFPAHHLFPLAKYTRQRATVYTKEKMFLPMITSRGCPYNCIYCNKLVFKRKFRARSPSNVVSEMRHIVERHGIREIHIEDDAFTLDRGRAISICNLILEQKLDITWSLPNGVRVDAVDPELLRIMKRAGCHHIGFGVESGDERVLKGIRKNITLAQAKSAVRAAKEAGMRVEAFFMVGLPGDTRNSIEKTIRFAKELSPDMAEFSITTPYPGTDLYAMAKGSLRHEDWSLYRHDSLRNRMWSPQGLTEEDLTELTKRAYLEFYLRPAFILHELRRVRSLRAMRWLSRGFAAVLKKTLSPRTRSRDIQC